MSGERDGLLDGWADQSRRLATCEAQLIRAVDLLMECVDEFHDHSRLYIEIRQFLLNVPVGGR